MVPYHSVIQGIVGPFNELMKQINLALRPLRSLAGIASFLTGLEVLSHAMNAQPMMRLRRGSVGDLDDVHMRVETFLGVDLFNRNLRANDRASALAVMGPCGTRIGFYDDQHFDLGNGEFAFNVVTGPEMVTIVRDLHDGKPPPTFPEEDPNDLLTRRLWVIQKGGEAVFGDNITSVRFDNTVFAPDEEEVTTKLCVAEVSTPGDKSRDASGSPPRAAQTRHRHVLRIPPAPGPEGPIHLSRRVRDTCLLRSGQMVAHCVVGVGEARTTVSWREVPGWIFNVAWTELPGISRGSIKMSLSHLGAPYP
jgi:hypothetical protein